MARAPINGSTLKWARESLNMDRDELGKVINVSGDRIEAFERGDQPTFKQLLKIANKLDRSAAFFFAPPPEVSDMPEIVDFRGHSGDEISTILNREKRRANQYRASFLELAPEWRETPAIDSFGYREAGKRSQEFRKQLGLTDMFRPPSREPNQVFNFWRDILEQNGFLVFQTTRVPFREFRGFSISYARLPVIVVNGSDAPNGKVFTLFHEVAHIANRTSGLCVLDEGISEEAVANAFSANFLMPRQQIEAIAPRVSEFDGDPIAMSETVASECRVSVIAAGVRLRSLNLLTDEQLQVVWDRSDEVWQMNRDRQKSKPGSPPHWRMRMRDLGMPYVGTVTEALDDGRVSLIDATYLMNARLPTVYQMIDEYRRNGGRK